ncbi:hypothetical protein EHP00_1435 [Ecytonucleospora hepatopenaei]|uniref:Transmembrane protein n=1 Tax=Ecytonucleospora hepatopenaei TaxID=646526 RepID=A0A1W0E7H1_9MICR|nr:hypothetical protein EHP00_1435 [Ecytonucleospora hepatopenaei]
MVKMNINFVFLFGCVFSFTITYRANCGQSPFCCDSSKFFSELNAYNQQHYQNTVQLLYDCFDFNNGYNLLIVQPAKYLKYNYNKDGNIINNNKSIQSIYGNKNYNFCLEHFNLIYINMLVHKYAIQKRREIQKLYFINKYTSNLSYDLQIDILTSFSIPDYDNVAGNSSKNKITETLDNYGNYIIYLLINKGISFDKIFEKSLELYKDKISEVNSLVKETANFFVLMFKNTQKNIQIFKKTNISPDTPLVIVGCQNILVLLQVFLKDGFMSVFDFITGFKHLLCNLDIEIGFLSGDSITKEIKMLKIEKLKEKITHNIYDLVTDQNHVNTSYVNHSNNLVIRYLHKFAKKHPKTKESLPKPPVQPKKDAKKRDEVVIKKNPLVIVLSFSSVALVILFLVLALVKRTKRNRNILSKNISKKPTKKEEEVSDSNFNGESQSNTQEII